MEKHECVLLETYVEAELIVVKPLLEEAGIEYLEKTCQEGEILELYTSSPGTMGVELWVRAEDEEKARKLVQAIE
ncbi:DUF2007 domain-containing protein [Clostridia bacterium]|nr:DUF2007 domain-containing protein [Clostridia bacterium]